LLWLLTALACDPFHAEFAPIEDAEIYTARDPSPPPTDRNDLQLLTYNIKFGGGRIDFFFDCHGDAVLMSEKQVDTHMRRIAELIRELDPDVVFLQEVDVNSKRSAYVDQLQYLLDHTELNHALYASHWRVDFVPSDGLGPVDSGNAIASKYRLTDGTRIALPLREDQPSLDRYFYLRRNVLTARLQLGERRGSVGLVATHTAAYSKDGTKLSHIERFKREMDEMMEAGLVVGAGDLNTLPPDSEQTHDFDDSACKGDFEADDYREEGDWLKPLYDDYASAIPLASYVADNAAYFSHTTSKDGFWNRKLDYIFSNGELEGGEVIQDASAVGIATMPLSDHAPLRATLSIEEL
jgi:endonuclease/exonuclease/phosphatase family metal-dependent hydrolase